MLQNWEDWEMGHAMAPESCSASMVAIRVRGGIRHDHGGLGTTQSMLSYMNARRMERLELHFSVGDPKTTGGDGEGKPSTG